MVITFCNIEWKIKELPSKHQLLDNGDTEGTVDFNEQTIYLSKDLSPYRKALTLTHELLHIVNDFVGISDDEDLVKRLEHHIYDLVRVFPEDYKI
jgi:hypothetical protein